jgi:hypothetical protein
MVEYNYIWNLPDDAVSGEFDIIEGRDPLVSKMERLEDGRDNNRWWTIAGIYEWMRFDDTVDLDTTSQNNFSRRKERDDSYLNTNTNISYYRIKSDLCKYSSTSTSVIFLLIRFDRSVSG